MKLYLIKEDSTNRYKVGITKQPIYKRMKQLQTGNSNEIVLVDYYDTDDKKLEQMVQGRLKKYQTQGEWFELPLDEVICFKKLCREVEEQLKFLRKENYFFKTNG
jgi:hypothetical protein